MSSLLGTVFENAAAPQRGVFLVLAAAILAAPILALLANSSGSRTWRRMLADLRIAGPLLGLLMAAANSFHMAHTVLRLPGDVTAKQIAPGVLEASALMVMGAMVGILALGLTTLIALKPAGRRAD